MYFCKYKQLKYTNNDGERIYTKYVGCNDVVNDVVNSGEKTMICSMHAFVRSK